VPPAAMVPPAPMVPPVAVVPPGPPPVGLAPPVALVAPLPVAPPLAWEPPAAEKSPAPLAPPLPVAPPSVVAPPLPPRAVKPPAPEAPPADVALPSPPGPPFAWEPSAPHAVTPQNAATNEVVAMSLAGRMTPPLKETGYRLPGGSADKRRWREPPDGRTGRTIKIRPIEASKIVAAPARDRRTSAAIRLASRGPCRIRAQFVATAPG